METDAFLSKAFAKGQDFLALALLDFRELRLLAGRHTGSKPGSSRHHRAFSTNIYHPFYADYLAPDAIYPPTYFETRIRDTCGLVMYIVDTIDTHDPEFAQANDDTENKGLNGWQGYTASMRLRAYGWQMNTSTLKNQLPWRQTPAKYIPEVLRRNILKN